MEIITNNEVQMQELGKAVARVLEEKDSVYLIGDLGVGKTTLARGIVRGLGYQGRVNSPTFTIMNIYQSNPVVYHLDFYRLSSNDIFDLGLNDYIGRNGISIIEWPESGENVLPEEALIIHIYLIDDDYQRERLVRISAQGEHYLQKIKELGKIVGTGS